MVLVYFVILVYFPKDKENLPPKRREHAKMKEKEKIGSMGRSGRESPLLRGAMRRKALGTVERPCRGRHWT